MSDLMVLEVEGASEDTINGYTVTALQNVRFFKKFLAENGYQEQTLYPFKDGIFILAFSDMEVDRPDGRLCHLSIDLLVNNDGSFDFLGEFNGACLTKDPRYYLVGDIPERITKKNIVMPLRNITFNSVIELFKAKLDYMDW